METLGAASAHGSSWQIVLQNYFEHFGEKY
jgi:hypothetical protein